MTTSNEEIERETARDRGVLNAADRKWLLMDRDEFIEEHSRQYWGQRRDKVTSRVRNAFYDFSLLFEHLDGEMYEEIFPRQADERRELEPHLQRALAFLMHGTGTRLDHEVDDNLSGRFKMSWFWEIIEGALEQHGISQGVLISDIDPPSIDGLRAPGIETIIERAEAGDELTGVEIEYLLQSDRADNERIYEAISEAVRSEHGGD